MLYGTMTASISIFCPYTQDPFHLFEEGVTVTNLINFYTLLSAGLNAFPDLIFIFLEEEICLCYNDIQPQPCLFSCPRKCTSHVPFITKTYWQQLKNCEKYSWSTLFIAQCIGRCWVRKVDKCCILYNTPCTYESTTVSEHGTYAVMSEGCHNNS